MKSKNEYLEVITELDDSKFKPLTPHFYCENEYSEECDECECEDKCKLACTSHTDCKQDPKCESTYVHESVVNTIYENLWSMFKKKLSPEKLTSMSDEEKRNTLGGSLTDYAWIPEVEKEFYAHPYHKPFIDEMEAAPYRMQSSWGFAKLNIEPSVYFETEEEKNEYFNAKKS